MNAGFGLDHVEMVGLLDEVHGTAADRHGACQSEYPDSGSVVQAPAICVRGDLSGDYAPHSMISCCAHDYQVSSCPQSSDAGLRLTVVLAVASGTVLAAACLASSHRLSVL